MSLKKIRLVIIAICVIFSVGFIASYIMKNYYGGSYPVISSGSPKIGGPFSLIDHTGKEVTQETYQGKFKLVLFGFTHCPDICPAELQVLSAALDQIGEKTSQVKSLFITIDPARDTQKDLAAYMEHFHDNISGLTGTKEQIAQAAKAYRVYYKKIDNTDYPDDYTMDHSAFIYLMDPEGKYITHFPYGTEPEKISATLKKLLS